MNKILLSCIFVLFTITLIFSQETADKKPFVEGEMLVQLEPNVSLYDIVKRFPIEYKLEIVEELSAPMRVWLVKFDHSIISHVDMQQMLYNDRDITISDYNYYIEMRETVPDDTQLAQQWHHVNTGQTSGTVDADIDSDLAWDISTGGTSATGDEIVVCIIESSNLDHDDLRNNRWINPYEIAGNGIDDDGNGYIDDIMGWNAGGNNGTVGYGTNAGSTSHGTNCSGMIAAVGDNNLGVVGANWNLKIMISTVGSLTQGNVISSYTYPLVQRQRWNNSNGTQGAFVVATSASWGIDNADPSNYPLWCNFYDTLGHYGIISVGATTNNNANVDVVGDMPTACSSPYMVGVGRTDHNDNTAGGYGVTTIDFGAPGINVRTTANNNGYTTTTGTSFSCPLTAGVIGLAYSIPCAGFMDIVKADPKLGADLVLQALMDGVDQKTQLAAKFITGGRLNAFNTMDLLMTSSCAGNFCAVPGGINVTTINAEDATVSWIENVSADSYTVSYRPVGTSIWDDNIVTGTSFQFTGLDSCTTYEYYMSALCDTTNSASSAIFTFTTQGCGACVDISYCGGESTDLELITLKITKPLAIANTFTFQAPSTWGANLQTTYAAGELVLVDDGTTGDSLGCNTLINTAEIAGKIAVIYRGSCEFGTKALNAQNAGAIGVIIINNAAGTMDMAAGTDGAAVSIPVAMISNASGATVKTQLDAGTLVRGILGTKKEWIQSVEVGSFTHISGDDQGYGGHFGQGPIELGTNGTYPITLTPGFQEQEYEIYFRSWIDLDQNGTFDTDELVFDQLTEAYNPVSGTITIPSDAIIGSSRMRILMSFKGPGQYTLPAVCDQFSFGEVEDYCVEITEGSNSLTEIKSTFVSIYPNPAKDILTVYNKHTEELKMEICDLMGRVVESIEISMGNSIIEVAGWNSGTYIYRLLNSSGESVKSGKVEIVH